MKSFLYATTFPTPVISSVTSEQTLNFPATRVLDYMHPKRPWKTTSIASQQDLLLDFGGNITLTGIFANGMNYAIADIMGDTSTGTTALTPIETYLDYTSATGGWQIPTDTWVGRRKVFYHIPSVTVRYVRWRIPAQATDDGQSAFSTGALAFTTNLTVMPGGHLWPIEQGAGYISQTNDFLDGGQEFLRLGERKYDCRFGGTLDGKTQQSHIITMNAVRPGAPFLYIENSWTPGQVGVPGIQPGLPEHSYLMRFAGDLRPRRAAPEVFDVDIALNEIV